MSGAGSLLLITRRKTSPTTVAHRNISRVPTLALDKGFESGDTAPEKCRPKARPFGTFRERVLRPVVRNVPLPWSTFRGGVCLTIRPGAVHPKNFPEMGVAREGQKTITEAGTS
jgi:hypothetical protein